MKGLIKMFNFKDKEIPKVIIRDENLEIALANWLRTNGNVSKEFGKILSNLVFCQADEIYLYGYIPETFTFKYYNKRLKQRGAFGLLYGRMDKETGKYINPRIVLSREGTRTRYECFKDSKGKITEKTRVVGYDRDLSDDVLYRRSLFNDHAEISIEKGEYSIGVSIGNPSFDQRYKSMYMLLNEEKLVNYLSNLVFPITVEEVYKKICEISLGSDMSIYPHFSLVVTKTNYYSGKDKVTDSIHLLYGKLEKFSITRNGTNVFIDRNDNWIYENFIDNALASVAYLSTAGALNYSFTYDWKASNEKKDSLGLPLLDSVVSNEIEDVKKKARTLFGEGYFCKEYRKGSN